MTVTYGLQWLLLAFFCVPLVETFLFLLGIMWTLFYKQDASKFDRLIIQITSVGKEFEIIQETIRTIRGYDLQMPYEIWVVIEPGFFTDYIGADKVIVVPKEFKCRPVDKARALEYSRLIRVQLKLVSKRTKLLLVDDDTLPSKKYVKRAYAGDYDLCQGVTTVNRWYGTITHWKHLVLSHLDDIRTRNCMIYCSVTQGVTQRPLFVHGEGLCMTTWAESIVTWDRPIVASDDLVFGTNAAHLGLSWGYFRAAIQLISPWTFKEMISQKRRWTWGNFQAIGNREIMPLGAAVFKGSKYGFGFVSLCASSTGAVLRITGVAKVPSQASHMFWISMSCWVASYALMGWINSGGQPNRKRFTPRDLSDRVSYKKREGLLGGLAWSRLIVANLFRKAGITYWGFRVSQTLVSLIMTPVTAIAPIAIITTNVFMGPPKKFIMIDKSNAAMKMH